MSQIQNCPDRLREQMVCKPIVFQYDEKTVPNLTTQVWMSRQSMLFCHKKTFINPVILNTYIGVA